MSREYIFYPAFIDAETKKIKPLLFSEDGTPQSIMWRSGSFIDGDYFTQNFYMTTNDDYDEKYKSYFCGHYDSLNKNAPTYVYKLSLADLCSVGEKGGFVNGYVEIEEAEMFYASESPQEYYYWEMSRPICAELYAELPKIKQEQYVRFATIDKYSPGYICNHLLEILDDMMIPYNCKGEKIILMEYSF